MAESPEIPEAKDPFEKKVALSIAIIAVLLALVGAKGEHAKTEAIIMTNQATDKWGEFQANSIKQHIADLDRKIEAIKPSASAEAEKKADKKTPEEYEKQKEGIKDKALELEHEAFAELGVHQKCHFAEMLLQLAVVLSSIAILTRLHAPWVAALALAAIGAVAGAMAFL